MTDDWTEADYGAEDGRADAFAGREPSPEAMIGDDQYGRAYRDAYDAALAEIVPDNVRQVAP